MDKHELGKLVTKVAHELRQEGTIIEFGREYDLTLIDLFFKSGELAHDFLFFAKHDGDPIYRGEKVDVPIGETADNVLLLLEEAKNWRTFAFENSLKEIYITVSRDVGDDVTRYLYSGGVLGPSGVPDDPLILF